MNILKYLLYILIVLIFIALSGCASNDTPSEYSVTDPINSISEFNSTSNSASLKKTAVLDIENGYSLKVLEINRKENSIWLSFRKDGQEYSTSVFRSGNTYDVKCPNGELPIYTISVDKIYDNSFLADLTYTTKPSISQDVQIADTSHKEPELSISSDTISRYYEWEYDDTLFSMAAEYDRESYEIYSERTRSRSFDQFVTDIYDDAMISDLSSHITKISHDSGYGEAEIPYITMAFVQSLPYVSDSASAGYDEYPRYPFETLYHGGGDCEDSSILLSALLYDMGYDVALITLPGHMAVGVKGSDDLSGSYYTYNGDKYFYLETTNSGWEVGSIPDAYRDASASLSPIGLVSPELRVRFTGGGEQLSSYSSIDVAVTVENVGSIDAKDVIIYVSVESEEEGMVWAQKQSDQISVIKPENSMTYSVSNLKVPSGEQYRIGVRAWGSNADVEYVYSEWFSS